MDWAIDIAKEPAGSLVIPASLPHQGRLEYLHIAHGSAGSMQRHLWARYHRQADASAAIQLSDLEIDRVPVSGIVPLSFQQGILTCAQAASFSSADLHLLLESTRSLLYVDAALRPGAYALRSRSNAAGDALMLVRCGDHRGLFVSLADDADPPTIYPAQAGELSDLDVKTSSAGIVEAIRTITQREPGGTRHEPGFVLRRTRVVNAAQAAAMKP